MVTSAKGLPAVSPVVGLRSYNEVAAPKATPLGRHQSTTPATSSLNPLAAADFSTWLGGSSSAFFSGASVDSSIFGEGSKQRTKIRCDIKKDFDKSIIRNGTQKGANNGTHKKKTKQNEKKYTSDSMLIDLWLLHGTDSSRSLYSHGEIRMKTTFARALVSRSGRRARHEHSLLLLVVQ